MSLFSPIEMSLEASCPRPALSCMLSFETGLGITPPESAFTRGPELGVGILPPHTFGICGPKLGIGVHLAQTFDAC
jgi:hypothetical protein